MTESFHPKVVKSSTPASCCAGVGAILALFLNACAAETQCPRPQAVGYELGEPENTCPGVQLRQPKSETCWQYGYSHADECSTSQGYWCANGVSVTVSLSTDPFEGNMVVTDEDSGCRTTYQLEPVR